MVLIGGVDPRNDTDWIGSADSGDEPADPWTQGISVFDLTYLKFKDCYEANAAPYEPPDIIKQWYSLPFVNFPLLSDRYSHTYTIKGQSIPTNLDFNRS